MKENVFYLLLLCFTCMLNLSNTQENFICFSDSGCGEDIERPVFYLGTSFDDCCAKPDVLSVLTDNCIPCVLSADRVTPFHVALYPPNDLVLEVTATGYDTISWFINGTAMHDFDQLLLENYNKKLTIVDTTVDDYGVYSADIHTLQNDSEVIVVDFFVYKYVSPIVDLSVPSEDEIVNDQLSITCVAYGNPVPSISVYCDNITITSFDDAIYNQAEEFGSLPNTSQTAYMVASEVNGINQCHCDGSAYDGENTYTETVSAQILQVPASIVSFQPDQSFSVIAPLKIELSCTGKGRPVPSVTWYKGDQEITSNTFTVKESITEFVISSSLTITNTSSADYGQYHCEVGNLYGAENSTTVFIDVLFPSNVTVPSTVVEVNVNIQNEVSLYCEAEGNPEPQIIWLGDGGILNDDCEIQGSHSDAFGEAAFDYDQFYSGDAPIDAEGYIPKNCEIKITRDDSVEGVLVTNSTLILRELNQESIQLTSFRCIAENNVANILGVTKYVKIVLKLEDDPYFLQTPLESYSLLHSNSASFNCDAIGQSSLIITWLKDGIALSISNSDISITNFATNDSNGGILNNSTLTINSLEFSDAGMYTCQAENNEGISQYNFTMDIIGVAIYNSLTISSYTAGETLVISCNITSTAVPVVSWIHRNVSLFENNRITIINNTEQSLSVDTVSVISTLIITELELADDGLYKCQAIDESFKAEENIAIVSIDVPVTATVNPNTVVHDNEATTIINCTATGIPAPIVQFIDVTCNGEELGEAAEAEENGNFSVYCIYGLQDDGLFTVTAMAMLTTSDTLGEIDLFCSSENSIVSTANDTGLIIVQAPPMIGSTDIGNIDIVANHSFTLSCNAAGYPAPTIVWRLDNNVLTNNNGLVIATNDPIMLSNGMQYVNSVLTVTNAEINNEGVYMCSFSNDAGTSNLTVATVDVKVLPTVNDFSESLYIHIIGNTTTVSCTGYADPAPVLIFHGLTCTHDSMFEDEATDDGYFYGNCSSEVDSGGVVTVTVSLTVSNDNELMLGLFELVCTANNSLGEVSSKTDIQLTGPSQITGLPQAITVEVGESILLICNVTGYPLPNVYWAYNNITDIIPSTFELKDVFTVQSALNISNINPSNEGRYFCVSKNDYYNQVNSSVLVTVIGVAPIISASYETKTSLVGSSVTLFCNASGLPVPILAWFKSDIIADIGSGFGEEITDSSSLSIITTETVGDSIAHVFSKLVIENVELLDEGLYSCLVSNKVGDATEHVGQLIVEEPPNISLPPSSITYTVPSNDSITIACTGTGKPQPSVAFGGLNCSGDSQDEIMDGGFTTTCNPSKIVDGLYYITSTITFLPMVSVFGKINFTCLVENSLPPVATGTTTVTINVDKTVLITPNDITVNESDSITLQCEATGYPLPLIDWIIGSESVIENDRRIINVQPINAYTIKSTLILSNVEPDDEEIYKCRAQSSGSFLIDSSSVQVTAIDECALLSDPCVNGACQDGLKEYTCVCDEGFSGTNCDIENPTDSIEIPVVTDNPRNKTEAILLGGINITCHADGDPEPTYSWYKDGLLVDNVTSSELIITEAKPPDRGYYYCEAINIGGNTTSDPGLVTIQGIFQYVAEIGKGSVFDVQTTIDEMVNCLASDYITGSNTTIIYSLQSCTAKGCQHDGIAAILLTLYQTSKPYSNKHLLNRLSNKLENVNADCDLQINITDIWRFDGCRETRENFHTEYSLSILWAESEIEDEIIQPCPCGALTSSVYTNSTTTRMCAGDYTDGGVWLDSDTSSCDYNEYNINITLTLCHLTEVYLASELASELEIITGASPLFQSLDFTIASIILENLALSEEIIEDSEIQEKFVNSISNLMSADNDVAADSEMRHRSTARILKAIDTFQMTIDLPDNETRFVGENLAFHIVEINASSFSNMTVLVNLDVYDSLGIIVRDQQSMQAFNASLSVPKTVLEEDNIEDVDGLIRVGYVVFLEDILFQDSPGSEYGSQIRANNLTIGSIITSASLSSDQQSININSLVTPIVIEFRKPESLLLNKTESYCVFWDDKNSDQQGWSSQGCVQVDISNDDIIRCECNHLTHFGYLLDVQPSDNQPDDLLALEIIIYILCILSIICLIVVVVTYSSSVKLRFLTQGKIIINMSIALIGVYTCYMIAVNAKAIRDARTIRGDILCGFFGALLYYFLLVYFMWTGLEAIDLYRKLVKVFTKGNKRLMIYGGIICWGVPLIISALAAVAGRDDYIEYEYFCRPVGPTFYISFLVPFVSIYVFNWILFIIIVAKLLSRLAKETEYKSSHGLDYRKIFFVAMILSMNFGLGWIFGLLVTSKYPEPLYITFIVIFSLFVGLQGILLFVLHCVRNQTARETWRVWFYILCCCENRRNAKTLAKSHYFKTPGATPAIHRKNFNGSSAPETSSKITPLAQKYFTSSVIDSEKVSIGSPLHESYTMETYLGPAESINLMDDFDFGKELTEVEVARMSKASLGVKSKTDEETLNDDGSEKKMSKQESIKNMLGLKKSKKNSKKAQRVEKMVEDDLNDSMYSLELDSQVLEIQYKPGFTEEDTDEEEEWQKLKEQFEDVNKIVNTSFLDTKL